MKILFLFFLTSGIFQNIQCLIPFELIQFTAQDWKGGQKQTGYGTYYEIDIVTKTNSENLTFDQLWIGEKYFEVSCFQKGKKIKNNTFGSGDTITIQVNDRKIDGHIINEGQIQNIDDKPNAPDYEGDALLSYIYKEKRKYFELGKFTSKKPIYYP
jgi:hypothetical protein